MLAAFKTTNYEKDRSLNGFKVVGFKCIVLAGLSFAGVHISPMDDVHRYDVPSLQDLIINSN
jgi:hypothetical protein